MWELRLQSAFGRLTSWTEGVEAPHQPLEIKVTVLHGPLEAHRQRLQPFDFKTWLEQAIDDEDEGDEPG